MSGGDSFQADRYTGHREEQKRRPPLPRKGEEGRFCERDFREVIP